MESTIIIKANDSEINTFFDKGNSFCYIKYMKLLRNGLYEVLLRHNEIENKLTGTFTIEQLNNFCN